MKNKFYVVWKGRTPGVYDSWEACKIEVEGFAGALYKGFPDKASAEAAFAKGFEGFGETENGKRKTENFPLSTPHSLTLTLIRFTETFCPMVVISWTTDTLQKRRSW